MLLMKLLNEKIEREIDDAVDDIIKQAAPELVAMIKEREVDEDVDEFYEGAIDAVDDMESMLDYRHPFEEKYEEAPTDSDLYRAGYEYGKANFNKISRGMQDIVDVETRTQQIKSAIQNFEERITEEAVIDALEKVFYFGKEQFDDIHALMKLAQKKYGWKAGATFVAIEIFEHALLPAFLSTINPAFGILAAVPTVEILAAAGLVIYKKYYKPKKKPAPHVPGHLDWYESRKLHASHKRKGTMKLSESQLRRLVRKNILRFVM